jgi:hypothetical protein
MLNTLFFNWDGSLSDSLAARPFVDASDGGGVVNSTANAPATTCFVLGMMSRRVMRFGRSLLVDNE